jgi:hypothetical protein
MQRRNPIPNETISTPIRTRNPSIIGVYDLAAELDAENVTSIEDGKCAFPNDRLRLPSTIIFVTSKVYVDLNLLQIAKMTLYQDISNALPIENPNM